MNNNVDPVLLRCCPVRALTTSWNRHGPLALGDGAGPEHWSRALRERSCRVREMGSTEKTAAAW
jgi:hypothetical protein